MDTTLKYTSVKILIVLLFILISVSLHILPQTYPNTLGKVLTIFQKTANATRIFESINSTNNTSMSNYTESIDHPMNNSITLPPTTTSTTASTTLDPAELLVERSPPPSRPYRKNPNSTIVAFLFQTTHHILASLQMHLIRKFTKNLVAIELFIDGPSTPEMIEAANQHQAILNSFPGENHQPNAGPSDRNTDIVNWAISTKAKNYLGNDSAIIMLDGDVFPLTPYDSSTLLNGHDVICRKHPALFARFCWIGLICIAPGLYDVIDSFNVSQDMRGGKAYDSGGKTAEFFLNHENVTFAWMKETTLLNANKSLFWGALDGDIQWIGQNFDPCDKCGPEIFFSSFNDSGAIFYHMISATSEWRFGDQHERRKAIHDSVMQSPLGPTKQYNETDMATWIMKIQQMPLIPLKGNFTCELVCRG